MASKKRAFADCLASCLAPCLALCMTMAICCSDLVSSSKEDGRSAPEIGTMNLDQSMLDKSNIPKEWYRSIDASCKYAIYVPPALKGTMADKILIIFGPQGTNIQAMNWYLSAGDELGAIVATPEHRRHDFDDRAHYHYSLQIIDSLMKEGKLHTNAQIVVAGFSGGGKMALAIGTYGAKLFFSGILAIGVNEDLASKAMGWLTNRKAFSTPIILLNATDDSLVNSRTQAVLTSLKRTGFYRVSHMTYSGGHRIPSEELVSALKKLFKM